MDALSFLYWSLGGGFLLLVLFLCIALFHLIRILRDIADTADGVRETVDEVSQNVKKVADRVSHVADHISNYFVKPFSMAQFFMEKMRPWIEMFSRGSASGVRYEQDGNEEQKEEPKRRRHRFSRRKRTKS